MKKRPGTPDLALASFFSSLASLRTNDVANGREENGNVEARAGFVIVCDAIVQHGEADNACRCMEGFVSATTWVQQSGRAGIDRSIRVMSGDRPRSCERDWDRRSASTARPALLITGKSVARGERPLEFV